MTDPLISVIMPAYNAQKYIAESIESVTRQTWQNWELIIVDDGSVDNTAAIINQYQLKDQRISYFYQPNAGPGSAKNTAISYSKGNYIAFLDADDLWTTDKLEISLNTIVQGNYSLVFTDCHVFNNDDLLNFSAVGINDETYEGHEGILYFLKGNRIPNLTVLVERNALLKAGKFGAMPVAEDYDMWLRMLRNGETFKSISNCLSLYRVHSESVTTKDRNCTFEVIQVIKSFAQKHAEYANEIRKIAQDKIKFWLYNGDHRSAKNFRMLITGVYQAPVGALFYTLSFIVPFNQLRKFVVRL